jgi:hypothetical protein
LRGLTESFDEISFTFSKLVSGNPFDLKKEQESKISFSGIKMLENSPVLCTAGMNFIKVSAIYLELMSVLTPISFEVFHGLTQLFEFFVNFI